MAIVRRLVHFDRGGECKVVDPDRLKSFFDPVVILGDPGVGKTTLLRRLCRQSEMTYVHAADLVRAGDPGSLISGDEQAAVDGLDEIASPGTGSAVEAVLRRLREADSPLPVLACRTAEWRDAADLARIEDAYAGKPMVLYLAAFGEDEAPRIPGRGVPRCSGSRPPSASAEPGAGACLPQSPGAATVRRGRTGRRRPSRNPLGAPGARRYMQ